MKQQFIAGDTETFDGLLGQEFACGCLYNGKTLYTFTDSDEFSEAVLRYEYPRYRIFFHNCTFDIRFLLQYCQDRKIAFPPGIIRGGSYIMQDLPSIKKSPDGKAKYVRIQDSYALLPMPLAKFPHAFGLQEEKVKMDFSAVNSVDDYIRRCSADVRILYHGLERLFQIFPSTRNALSLAQATMREFRSGGESFCFTTKRVGKKVEVDDLLEQEARLGYCGGRSEIFKFQHFDRVYYYDKNSLHPYVMRENYYPIGIKEEKPDRHVLDEPLYYIFATVNVPYMYAPPLPFRRDKLYFPYGKMTGWFYSPEFDLIKDYLGSSDLEIHKAYSFTPSKIFKEFIEKYWKLRRKYQEEKNGLQTVVKLYMNSLYGKFGQRRECLNRAYVWDIEPGCEELADGVYTKATAAYSRARFINPFISSFIASYARAELWRALDEDAIFCDTDSVVTTKQVRNIGTDLGQFKLEGCGEFQAFAPKTYFFRDDKGVRSKAKGVYREFIKGDTPDDFLQNIRRTEKAIYAKPREAIRRYGRFMCVKNVTKELRFTNNKRIVLANRDTEPYDAVVLAAR